MNKKQRRSTDYIFLDESGKPEVFSRKGLNLVEAGTASKYLIIAAVQTDDHLAIQEAVTAFRLDLLRDPQFSSIFSPAYSLDAFHAQTDYPKVRQRFYQWINNCQLDLKITVIVAEKLHAYSQLQHDSGRFYASVAGQLLKRFLHTADNVEVIFSRRDTSLRARERLQLVVDTLRLDYAQKANLDTETRIIYHHNPHYTHGGLQIADYIAHALFQVFEHQNLQWWEIISQRVGSVQDLFNKKFYTRSNPLKLDAEGASANFARIAGWITQSAEPILVYSIG